MLTVLANENVSHTLTQVSQLNEINETTTILKAVNELSVYVLRCSPDQQKL
jgi:hypothetical protein